MSDRQKRARAPYRRAVTLLVQDAETELAKEEKDFLRLQVLLEQLEMKFGKLQEANEKVREAMLDENADDTTIEAEETASMEYDDKAIVVKVKFKY